MKRTWMKGTRTALAAIAITAAAGDALAQGTLRVGMTAWDIPLTTGQTDNGGDFSPIWMAK
jgi:peptide/nickel transport system substrate-binding protein